MSKKPPIGLIPQTIHLENRLNQINDAIKRYLSADYRIKIEWIEERNHLIQELGYGEFKEN